LSFWFQDRVEEIEVKYYSILHMMKLVEETSGIGELSSDEAVLRQVQYRLNRFQGMTEQSEMPIPGLFRIEGSIEFNANSNPDEWVGIPLRLKLQDGRVVGITVVTTDGRILSEGHGPSKCLCC
jgi:hypothetical protein